MYGKDIRIGNADPNHSVCSLVEHKSLLYRDEWHAFERKSVNSPGAGLAGGGASELGSGAMPRNRYEGNRDVMSLLLPFRVSFVSKAVTRKRKESVSVTSKFHDGVEA